MPNRTYEIYFELGLYWVLCDNVKIAGFASLKDAESYLAMRNAALDFWVMVQDQRARVHGDGSVPVEEPEPCENCGGEGVVPTSVGLDREQVLDCPECSPAPEGYDKHEGSPDSLQTRHNSPASEIKVGQRWRWKLNGLETTVADIEHGFVHMNGLDHGWSVESLVRDWEPAPPSLNPEGLAKLDADIRRLVSKKADLEVYVAGRLLGLQQAREWLVSEEAENGE